MLESSRGQPPLEELVQQLAGVGPPGKTKLMNMDSTTGDWHDSQTKGAGMQPPIEEWSAKRHTVEPANRLANLISLFFRYKFAYVGLVSAHVISVAFLLPPKYNVEAIVSLLPNKPFDVDLEQLDKGRGRTLSASEQPVEAAIALLVSENLIKTAIETVGASNMYPAPGNDIDKAY